MEYLDYSGLEIFKNKIINYFSGSPIYIAGEGSTAGTWLGTSSKVTSYYSGLAVLYTVPVAGASTTTLNINGLGAKKVFRNGTSSLSTQYPVNSSLLLVYNETLNSNAGGWQSIGDYDSTDTQSLRPYYTRYFTGADALTKYKLCAEDAQGRIIPLNIGDTTAATKTAQTVGFNPKNIYVYNMSSSCAANSVIEHGVLYNAFAAANTNFAIYNFNESLAVYKNIYLKGTYNKSTGLFTLDNTSATSWYVLAPYNEDFVASNYFDTAHQYINIGRSYSSTNYFYLYLEKVMYDFNGTVLVDSTGDFVTHAINSGVTVIGTSKTTESIGTNQLVFPNGAVFSGTAAIAGLVTRGICGVSTPTATGACEKENLYINYDNTNTYNAGRQLVLQAGTTGTHYGNNLYQYAAARGDAVKDWVESKGYLTSHQDISGKVNVSDIKNNLTSTDTNKPLSAYQGKLLNDAISAINTLLGSDNADLDTLQEVVDYVENHQTLLDGISTSKVNIADIINNLTSNVSSKPLSAAQGYALKALVDEKAATGHTHTKSQITDFPTIPIVNNATLTIQKNGTDVGTFTANSSTNVTANITVPTTLSGFTDNLGSSPVHTHSQYLTQTTYEYNKEISFGSSGKLCIGKFPMYDSLITVEIKSSTSITYNGTLVIATQNINTSGGGSLVATVYGDASDTVTPNIYIYKPTDSRVIEVYFSPANWSKNLVHIQCQALAGTPTDIATSVSEIPSTANIQPTNALKDTYYPNTNPNGYTSNTGTITGVSVNGTSIATSGVAALTDIAKTNTNNYFSTSQNVSGDIYATGSITALNGKFSFSDSINVGMEIGRRDGTGGTPYLDFHTDGSASTDYNSRLLASGSSLYFTASGGVYVNSSKVMTAANFSLSDGVLSITT